MGPDDRPADPQRTPPASFTRWALVGVGVASGVFALVVVISVVSGGWAAWGADFTDAAETVAYILLATAIAFAAGATHGTLRIAWALVGVFPIVSVALTFFGFPEDGGPVWAQALDALALSALIVGLVLMVVPVLNRRQLVRFLLDAFIAGGSTAFLLIAGFELGKAVPATSATPELALLAVAVSVLAVVLAAVIVLVLAHTRRATPVWYRLVAGGLLTVLLALLVGALVALGGSTVYEQILAVASVPAWLMLALGAFMARDWPDEELEDPPAFAQWAVYVPFTLSILAAGFDYIEEGGLTPDLFFLAIGVVAIVTVRTLVILRENSVLTKTTEEQAAFKTQLLRFISHEMANPLSPLRLQVEVHKRTGSNDQRGGDVIERSVHRLESISKDVRALALAETGRLVQDFKVQDLRLHVRDACRAAQGLAERKGLTLKEEFTQQPCTVDMDVVRIGQVVDNLLSNAIKFTPKGGTITVRTGLKEDEAVVSVEDSGLGLNEGQLHGLFKAFGRVHGKDAPTGLGLGLYLSLIIVSAHNGRIWAESPGEGQGATFHFALPLADSIHSPDGPKHVAAPDDSEE